MLSLSKLTVGFLTLVASLSMGSALANCVAVPLHAENGKYEGCEVIHGGDVKVHEADLVREDACPALCKDLSDMDELAAESLALDEKIGLGGR